MIMNQLTIIINKTIYTTNQNQPILQVSDTLKRTQKMSRNQLLIIALLIISICVFVTSCTTNNLSGTCSRFGMDTQYVDVIALDHDIDGKGFRQTKFHCVPKVKLKSGK